MTRRLYNEDSMIREFDGEVISCEQYENNGTYKIILNQTAFFPTGGGQTADAGWLSFCIEGNEVRVKVVDGKDSGDQVWHITDNAIPVGTKVRGELNWEERFSKMQQHTGEHIVSGIITQKYGFNNVGFHLGADIVTMDFDEELGGVQLAEVEIMANKIIWANIPVNVLYPNKDEIKELDYRSKIEIEGQVRVVQIPDVDCCACCAPHVKTTGMVGMIKFIDAQRHRGGVRISLACGDRALQNFQEKSNHSKQISRILSVKENELSAGVERLNKECVELKYKLKNLEILMVKDRVDVLQKEGILDSEELIILFENKFTSEQSKNFVNQLVELNVKSCIVFTPVSNEEYHFIGATSTGDMRSLATLLREKFGAKGGGNANQVQGKVFGCKEDICAALKGIEV